VKLTDFGLACAVDDRESAAKGMLAGTPEFMAPEQAAAGRVDHRADLFSLGSVLYAMCTGGPPFHTDSAQTVLHRIRHDKPPRVDQSRADLPEWLGDVIEKLHRMEPARRYSSAAEVADLFDGHLGHQSSATNERGSSTGCRLGLAMSSILFLAGVFGLVALVVTQFEADGQEESTNVVASEGETPAADVPDLVRRFEGHSDWVHCVALSANGQRALTGGKDKTMRLWDVKTGQQLREFGGHDGTVVGVIFAADGNRALSSAGNAIRLWDLENGQEVRRFEGHSSSVTTAALSPDGRHVLSGSYDRTVRLWEVETGLELSRFADHRNWVLSVAVSADGRHVLSGGGGVVPQRKGSDFAIRLWDLGQAIAKAESDLRFQEMRKLQGTWKVISYELDGRPLEASTAQFVFRAAKVIVNDGDKRLEVHYGLSPTEEPKQITLSSFPGHTKGSVSGTYSWEEERLIICLVLRADGLEKVKPDEQRTIPRLTLSLRRE